VSLLAAIQCKAALWILGAFCTSPTGRIEALTGLTPVQLHLKKLVKWSCLRTATLPSQHALMSLLSAKHSKGTPSHKSSSHPSVSYVVMDYLVKRPLSIAKAVPESNPMARTTTKEQSECKADSQGVGSSRMH